MPAYRLQILPVAFALYLTLLPLLSFTHYSPHDLARLCQLPLFALATVFLLVTDGPLSNVRVPAKFAAGALATTLLISCITAAKPSVALQELLLAAGLLSLALAWSQHVSNTKNCSVLPIAASTALYVGAQFVVYLAALANGQHTDSWGLAFGYDNPRFLNHVQTLAIPFLTAAAQSSHLSKTWKRLATLGLLGHMMMLTATLGRGTMLALLVSGIFALVAFGKEGRVYASRLAIMALAAFVAHMALFVLLPKSMHLGSATSGALLAEAGGGHSRIGLWQLALADIRSHPWLGIGPMHFAHQTNPTAAHPHNIYLQIAAETGLPAFALIMTIVTAGMYRAFRRLREMPNTPRREVGLAAFIACMAASLDGFVSGNFVMPMSQVWIAFAAGTLVGSVRSTTAPAPFSQADRRLWRAVTTLLLASMVWLCVTVLHQAVETPPRIGTYTQAQLQDAKHRPRFWLDGWF